MRERRKRYLGQSRAAANDFLVAQRHELLVNGGAVNLTRDVTASHYARQECFRHSWVTLQPSSGP